MPLLPDAADAVLDLVIRAPPSEAAALVEGWRGSGAAGEDAGWLGALQLSDALLHDQREQVGWTQVVMLVFVY
jgi:hypothetical protein